jgi:hypothetical protein
VFHYERCLEARADQRSSGGTSGGSVAAAAGSAGDFLMHLEMARTYASFQDLASATKCAVLAYQLRVHDTAVNTRRGARFAPLVVAFRSLMCVVHVCSHSTG